MVVVASSMQPVFELCTAQSNGNLFEMMRNPDCTVTCFSFHVVVPQYSPQMYRLGYRFSLIAVMRAVNRSETGIFLTYSSIGAECLRLLDRTAVSYV